MAKEVFIFLCLTRGLALVFFSLVALINQKFKRLFGITKG